MAEGDTQVPEIKETKHGTVMVGELPSGFLQMELQKLDQVSKDEQLAHQIAAQQVQQSMMRPVAVTDRLLVSVVEAKLMKNYGIIKMDPYCRLRIGHNVYETDTSPGGAKNPRWTKSISAPYSADLKTIYLEVFDERSMSTDCRIAWTTITLPENIKKGEPVDDWWPLSGKLGEESEGTVHLLISVKKVQQHVNPQMQVIPGFIPQGSPYPAAPSNYYAQSAGPSRYYSQPPHQPGATPIPPGPMFSDDDVKTVKELFPNVEDDVVKAVLEASRGNKDAAINSLLSMQ